MSFNSMAQPISSGSRRSQDHLNFALPRSLTLLTVVEALILLTAAIVLFGFPQWEGLRWPWDLKPYNTVFLGGIYWAAFAVVSLQILIRRWAPARIVQPLVLVFSGILMAVSLAYFDVFDWQRRLVKAWFLVYTVVPLGAAWCVCHYRDRAPARAIRLPQQLRGLMQLKAGVLSLYGLALLVIPAIATAFWPWTIDPFHARLYSAIFLAMGLGNALLARSTAAVELLVLGVAELLLGALPVLGIARLDHVLGDAAKIIWTNPGVWIWFSWFGLWAIAGLQLMRQAWRHLP